MKPSVETNFKNSNLKFVEAFGRTGGEHHPVLPQMLWTRNQISRIGGLHLDSLLPSTSVEDLHLKIGKIPVYSASPWIESLAHTVYDEYHNIVSIYYTNDPEVINIHYKVHSSKLALKELQRNK